MTKVPKRLALVCALVSCAITAQTAGAAIATWNFDSGTDNGSAYSGTTTYNVNTYDHALLGTPIPQLGTTLSANTTLSAGTGNGGVALQFNPGTGQQNKEVGGSTFTLTLKAAAHLTTFSITYDAFAPNVGGHPSVANTWTYSINGGTSQAAASNPSITEDGSFHTVTATFSGINLNAGDTIVFTDTLGNYGQGTTARFDNINVTAVPEPIHYALAAFGLCVAGVGAGRRVYAWARA